MFPNFAGSISEMSHSLEFCRIFLLENGKNLWSENQELNTERSFAKIVRSTIPESPRSEKRYAPVESVRATIKFLRWFRNLTSNCKILSEWRVISWIQSFSRKERRYSHTCLTDGPPESRRIRMMRRPNGKRHTKTTYTTTSIFLHFWIHF